MRLTKVRVTKLFGLFDHEIPLNLEERITIIHGPNGFGKTVILRMVSALLSRDYSLFQEIPFESFAVEFEDGQCLSVKSHERILELGEARERRVNVELIFSFPGVSEPRSWMAISHSLFGSLSTLSEPEWLGHLYAESQTVRLVRAQRLIVEEHERKRENRGIKRFFRDPDADSPKPTVEFFSEEITGLIRQALAVYAARSQELDRTFPVRLMGQGHAEPLAAEELRRRMAELEQKRAMLTRLGFLEPEQGLEQAPVQAIETKRDVLTIYVGDVESKLAIFDVIASKIQLFTQVINERFLYKRLEIHREQGFVFTSASGARLTPSDLSSGEQHELILFYELLFKLEKNALVLIDEPEISLHVAWQEKFLGDLMEVVKLSEIDVVVATHSPEIIGEHWDLAVELKGPSEIRKD